MGFYDHTAWHRVVRNFVIQGGDMGSRNPPLQMAEASGIRRLQPEFSKLKHVEGIVSMARGEALDSAETSFFICLAPQPVLDNKYTIFGKVVSGMDVVAKISNVPLEGSKPRERVEVIGTEILEVSTLDRNEAAGREGAIVGRAPVLRITLISRRLLSTFQTGVEYNPRVDELSHRADKRRADIVIDGVRVIRLVITTVPRNSAPMAS